MKKFLLLILFCGIVVIGCERNATEQKEIDNLLKIAFNEQEQDNIDGAINILNEAIEKYNNVTKLYIQRSIFKCRSNDFEGALEDLNKALKLEPQAIIYEKRGMVKYNLNNFEEALEDLNKALELEPQASVYAERGMIKVQLKDFKGALEDLNKALEINSKAWMYNERSKIKVQLKDFKGALEDLNKILGTDYITIWKQNNKPIGLIDLETIARAYLQRVEVKINMKDFKGALEDLNKALGEGAEDWMYIQKEDGEKIELKDLKQFKFYTKMQGTVYFYKMILKKELGDIEGALEYANKSLNLGKEVWLSNIAKVYAERGEIYKTKGEKQLAIQDFKNALSIDPTLENAAKSLNELDK